MDSIKLEQLITENMKSIFGFALTRLGNVNEADELAAEILYALVRSVNHLSDEARFYGFMWKIAENTYMEYLRKKTRHTHRTAALDETLHDEADSPLDSIIRQEELNLLRRELSLLAQQYRKATVLYYIDGLSCSAIAEKLQTGTEMIKYYLFRARNILREGMNMEREYGEKSYRPGNFEIDFWGTKAGDDYEYRDFARRKIKGNILLAAYYSPITIQELSIELGVALPYLEDELKLLLDRQYLICKNGKYLTNIPIFTLDCTGAIDEKCKTLTASAAEQFITAADEFDARFGDRFACENLSRWQKLLLCLHFAMLGTEQDLEAHYAELPADGPYALVNGGGGRGIIWGRSTDSETDKLPRGIEGIYNGCPSNDRRGSVIAMNFRQTLNAQHFMSGMTDPVVCAAVVNGAGLPQDWKDRLERLGYLQNGRANFAVWTFAEYKELQKMLEASIAVVSALNRETAKIAADIAADLAPAHIRRTAEYVGAFVYCLTAIENLVDTLFDRHWLSAADDREKPALCVVKN